MIALFPHKWNSFPKRLKPRSVQIRHSQLCDTCVPMLPSWGSLKGSRAHWVIEANI